MKTCLECSTEKSIEDFYIDKGKPRARCKECVRHQRKEYYQKHSDVVKKRVASYRAANSELKVISDKKSYIKHRKERLVAAKIYRNTEKGRQLSRIKNRMRRATVKIGDRYLDIDIFERDGWVCWLCNFIIDKNIKYPNNMCASIDHIELLSLGGTDTIDNVKASHLICNIKRKRK